MLSCFQRVCLTIKIQVIMKRKYVELRNCHIVALMRKLIDDGARNGRQLTMDELVNAVMSAPAHHTISTSTMRAVCFTGSTKNVRAWCMGDGCLCSVGSTWNVR